jgi:transposase-like protein
MTPSPKDTEPTLDGQVARATDGHQAMLNAIGLKFPSSKRQRCVRHKMENVLSHVPDKQRDAVREELRAIFYQPTRAQAEQLTAAFIAKYQPHYPSAIACLERDWAALHGATRSGRRFPRPLPNALNLAPRRGFEPRTY